MVHVKSDEGNLLVARAQAAYDGALAARGMQCLWACGSRTVSSPEVPDVSLARVARTITCTWHGGVLKMYAMYCQQESAAGDSAPTGDLASDFARYIPSYIGSWIMTDKEEYFRGGIAAYRNGLDWAKRQRDMVISRANARVRAEQARRRRDEEEDADEGDQSRGEGNYEEEDIPEENDGSASSIFARRRSEPRGEDEDSQDSEPADENFYQSFDSQRTVTTRSMSRKQLEGQAPHE